MIRLTCSALAVGAMCAFTPTVSADIFEFNFVLDGEQEPTPVFNNSAGAATLIYDDVTQTFDFTATVFGIELDDLMGAGPNSTPIHIHNAPPGVNGGIVIDLGFLADFMQDGDGITITIDDAPFGGTFGGVMSNVEDNEEALFAGDLYVNIHTVDFPGGELRGQIVPAPGVLALLGVAGLTARRRRRN